MDLGGEVVSMAAPIFAEASLSSWWDQINESPKWQDGVFYFLCAAYALVSSVALAQGIFYSSTRFSWFIVLLYVHTACTVLGRNIPSGKKSSNGQTKDCVHLHQYCHLCYSVVSFVAALGFAIYGGRLFFLLRRFPIESKGRRKKLHEVGYVTAICFACFLIRCFVVGLSAFDRDASLEVLDHPILDLVYYMLTEILPSALVLYILRKLPPKRVSAQHHPIQ